jgi:hypothetical protein
MDAVLPTRRILQHAVKLDLGRQPQDVDLVQEHRAPVGLLDQSFLGRHGARERAADMPE